MVFSFLLLLAGVIFISLLIFAILSFLFPSQVPAHYAEVISDSAPYIRKRKTTNKVLPSAFAQAWRHLLLTTAFGFIFSLADGYRHYPRDTSAITSQGDRIIEYALLITVVGFVFGLLGSWWIYFLFRIGNTKLPQRPLAAKGITLAGIVLAYLLLALFLPFATSRNNPLYFVYFIWGCASLISAALVTSKIRLNPGYVADTESSVTSLPISE